MCLPARQPTIATILNITRIHISVSAPGNWARGLVISRTFSCVRRVGGKTLIDVPMHMRTLASQHLEYRAMLYLAFFGVALLGISEAASAPAPVSQPADATPAARFLALGPSAAVAAPLLLRLLASVSKALIARAAISGLAERMEPLGAVGYLENEDAAWNVARLFHDANVLSIWEGTTNVIAENVVRVLTGREVGEVQGAVEGWCGGGARVGWGGGDEWRARREIVERVWEGD